MIFVIIGVIFVLAPHCLTHDLPSHFPRCFIDDRDLNNCILKACETLKPFVRKGIKEIKLPSFEPLILSTFSIIQESQMANYTVTVNNYTIQGMDNYDIKEISYDPKTLTLSGRMEFDPISINTVYDMQGSLVSIPILGKGIAQAALGPINGTFEFKGHLIKRKGIEYYNPKQIKVRMLIDDGSFFFTGLFDGSKQLAHMTNDMLNEHSKGVVDAVTPAIEKLTEGYFMRFMKSLTNAIPYNKLFPRSH